jgi:hypothetical protein
VDVLVDLGRIELAVNLLRARRVRLELAGDAVVEAHPERDDEVRLLDRSVDPGFAVHAHHPERQRVARREAAQAEQRRRDRDARLLDELVQESALAPAAITPWPQKTTGRSA